MITLIFLAGGVGARMGSMLPKQYLELRGAPIALHSYETFCKIPEITEIVVVCEPEYQYLFENAKFAPSGKRRQDSVYSGLCESSGQIILIHDSARPFIEPDYVNKLIEAVQRTGAAALAIPVTSTIKCCTPNHLVEKTLERSALWEMQTPQGARRDLLLKAYAHSFAHNTEATDDLSLIEAIGHPAEIVPCTPKNFKITTPTDLAVANAL